MKVESHKKITLEKLCPPKVSPLTGVGTTIVQARASRVGTVLE